MNCIVAVIVARFNPFLRNFASSCRRSLETVSPKKTS